MTPRKLFLFLPGVFFLLTILIFSLGSSQEISTQPPPIENMADLEALFAQEPSYGAIQDAAMRFAEVHPEKIAAWRSGASLRAFLPEVEFRYGVSERSTERVEHTYGTSQQETYSSGWDEGYSTENRMLHEEGEMWTLGGSGWSKKDAYTWGEGNIWSSAEATGERNAEETTDRATEQTGRDWGWSVRLRWDLRDFLYNDEQPKISKEARGLVELRQDVLEQVNTYFFDRRRAQIEMIFSPPSDVRAKIDLQLRIARLTANIDALTGGFLSKSLEAALPAL